MFDWLSGLKTYIIAAAAIATAVGAYFSGALDLAGLVQAIFVAFGAMALRSGITTEAAKK